MWITVVEIKAILAKVGMHFEIFLVQVKKATCLVSNHVFGSYIYIYAIKAMNIREAITRKKVYYLWTLFGLTNSVFWGDFVIYIEILERTYLVLKNMIFFAMANYPQMASLSHSHVSLECVPDFLIIELIDI